jgi:hypothetical protein
VNNFSLDIGIEIEEVGNGKRVAFSMFYSDSSAS